MKFNDVLILSEEIFPGKFHRFCFRNFRVIAPILVSILAPILVWLTFLFFFYIQLQICAFCCLMNRLIVRCFGIAATSRQYILLWKMTKFPSESSAWLCWPICYTSVQPTHLTPICSTKSTTTSYSGWTIRSTRCAFSPPRYTRDTYNS